MKIELFLISAYEEYAEKHACRKHWNFQWRGRRSTEDKDFHICKGHWMYQWRARRGQPYTVDNIKIRQESFGGLMQTPDGK